jgi:imidazolonepropionase-like amidohydrolase
VEAATVRIDHQGLLVAVIAAVLSAVTLAQSVSAERPLVLTGARVYASPREPVIRSGALVIRNGRIAYVGSRNDRQVPDDATVIDCTGQIVTAGFWNSHVHFTDARWEHAATMPAAALSDQVRQMLVRHGFTTVFDSGSYWPITTALRRRIDTGAVTGPRILTAGEILFPKGGALPPSMLKKFGMIVGEMPQVETPAQASLLARTMLDRGADGIKVYLATWWNDPPVRMSPAIVRLISDVTHRRRKLVLAHPTDLQGIETALAGGVDVLMHTTPVSGPWTDILAARLRQRRVALTPTLKLWRVELLRDGNSEANARAAQQVAVDQLRTFVRAGGEVLFGTDVGYMPEDDPTEEYELMAAAGMDFTQILMSLTTAPAGRFGEPERRGRIASGQVADLVVLDADPAYDVTAFARVARVIRNGRIIYEKAR